jgi:hypothetical protein
VTRRRVLVPGQNVRRILREWSAGEASALERLAPVVYAELHRIAARNMARDQLVSTDANGD